MNHLVLLLAFTIYLPSIALSQTAGEPKELIDLRGSFEKARIAALSPLEKKYIDALAVLKDRLTKSGDLNGALSVQAELTKFTVATKDDSKLRLSKFGSVDEFTAWLSTTSWRTVAGSVFTFPNGDSMESTKTDSSVTKYVLTVEKIGVVSWNYSTGNKEIMEITSDLKNAKGSSVGLITRDTSQ